MALCESGTYKQIICVSKYMRNYSHIEHKYLPGNWVSGKEIIWGAMDRLYNQYGSICVMYGTIWFT